MRRHLVTAVLAALVLAGGLLADDVDQRWPVDRGFVRSGTVGEPVAVWPGYLTVHAVRASTSYEDEYGTELTTGGVWVAVEVSVQGGDEPVRVGGWWLTDDAGREFHPTERLTANHLGHAQPDSPIRGEIVFEVPADAVGDMTFHGSPGGTSPQLAAVAAVPVRVEEVEVEPMTRETPQLEPR